MCTIRRSRIKKLINQQRKGKYKEPLFLINLDCFPEREIDKNRWEEALKLLNTKGVVFADSRPSIEIIKFKPRRL